MAGDQASGDVDVTEAGDTRVEQAKFDLGIRGRTLPEETLPWSYGENRITAIVRDPESAYLYWEISDDAIAAARARLGKAGAAGWCNLRVYDTTGRDFDGTNANDYFDIRIERADREYFLMIRRPTSTMHVEVGVKTVEGYFQAISRSGRAEFPRDAPSPNRSVDWMTFEGDDSPPAAAPYRSRYPANSAQRSPRAHADPAKNPSHSGEDPAPLSSRADEQVASEAGSGASAPPGSRPNSPSVERPEQERWAHRPGGR